MTARLRRLEVPPYIFVKCIAANNEYFSEFPNPRLNRSEQY
jgi:hypothetical protein